MRECDDGNAPSSSSSLSARYSKKRSVAVTALSLPGERSMLSCSEKEAQGDTGENNKIHT